MILQLLVVAALLIFSNLLVLLKMPLEIGLEKLAKDLAIQTIVGSAKLIEKSNLHPQELRDQVTFPMAQHKQLWKVFRTIN